MLIPFSDPELLNKLQRQSARVLCRRDRVLFRQGDVPLGLYILNKGRATLSRSIPGREAVVFLHESPNSMLGLPELMGSELHALDAIAHCGAVLSFVTGDDFAGLVHSEPLLFQKALRMLAAEVVLARQAIMKQLIMRAESAANIPAAKDMGPILPVMIAEAECARSLRFAVKNSNLLS